MRLCLSLAVSALALIVPSSAFAVATASFTVSDNTILVGEQVTFNASGSTGTAPLVYDWDLDGDTLYDDAQGVSVTREFGTAGSKTVRLRVTDADPSQAFAQQTVTVSSPPPPANKLPTASFRVFPAAPVAGEPVDLVSISSDPDGPIFAQAWDLDGDGQYDDATGATAARTYPAGSRTIGLRVIDVKGAASVQRRTVVVSPKLLTPKLLSPFPVVRLVGRLTRTGARIRSLTVAAPAGSSVILRCNGPRCPVRRVTTVAKPTGRAIRFKTFERRLRAGVVLQVFVMRDGAIGKHTRFAIRKRRAPARRDRCLQPGAKIPSPCPSS